MASAFPFGSDAGVYERAAARRASGAGIYLEGIARLEADHQAHRRGRTLNYIYPPVTLPLVRAAGFLSPVLRIGLFWLLYTISAAVVLQVQGGALFNPRASLAHLLTPACLFFPGLLNDDYLLAGNVAPPLYALVALAALRSSRRDQWRWFYLAVLFASLFKPPLLTLLAIAPLLKQGQWPRALGVGALGLGCFFFQSLVSPQPFAQYLRLMDLECLYNGEFGCSPAGELGKILLHAGLPYKPLCVLFYVTYAAAVLLLLLACARHFFAGRLAMVQWLPVLLLGVLLLNPRIKQYDVAAVTLPMAVLAYQALTRLLPTRRAALLSAILLFAALNAVAGLLNAWDALETFLMAGLFVVSALHLLQQAAKGTPLPGTGSGFELGEGRGEPSTFPFKGAQRGSA